MEVTAKKPVEELKKQLFSKKMLAIAIIFSVQVVLALIDKIQNRVDLSQPIKLFEQLFGADFSGVTNILDGISTAIFVVSLFSLIPIAATAVAFWFIYVGASNEKNKRMLSTGFLIFKVYVIVAIAWLVLCLLAVLVICFILGNLFTEVGLEELSFFIPFVLFGLVSGIVSLVLLYLLKVKNMLFGITNTLKTGRNLYYIYTYVIFVQILGAVFSVFGAFSSVSAFLNNAASIAVSVLYLTMMFSYKREVGLPDKNEIKTVLDDYRKSRRLPDPVEGYVPDFFEGENDIQARPAFVFAKTQEQPSERQSRAMADSKPSPVVRKESVYEPFEVHVIDVFSEQENGNARFVRLGALELPEKQESPVKLVRSEVYKDTLTERRILRLYARNDSGVDVSGLVLSILPCGNENNVLGSMEEVRFDKANQTDQIDHLSRYGIILPDGTTFGTVRMKKIFFSDGLYWDKGGDELKFVTEEKIDFDIKLYLSLNND